MTAAPGAAVLPVSVALLVKDEAARLPEWLASLPGRGEEVVALDTGSTDDTVGLLQAHGVRVERGLLNDDFSAARNLLLARCTRPWVLVLDADERLPADAGEVLAAWTRSRRYAGYWLARDNFAADGTRLFRDAVLRLFRNAPDIRFRGVVHESVAPALAALGGRTARLPLTLRHAAVRLDMAKSDRYLRLLARARAEQPDDWSLWDHQGCEYFRRGDYRAALAAFDHICRQGGRYPAAYANAGVLLARFLDAPGRAAPYLEEALRQNPEDEDVMNLLRQVRDKANGGGNDEGQK